MGNTYHRTRTQEIRAAYPYREKYFEKNPGIFGCIWICSQCYKPIIGKKNVVIDHIMPLAKGGRNHVSNCTACCRKCNSEKSDIVDHRVLKGKIFKIFESNAYRTQRGIGAMLALSASLVMFTARIPFALIGAGHMDLAGMLRHAPSGILGILGSLLKFGFGKVIPTVFKIGTFPIRRGIIVSRLYFVALYALVIFYALREYTTILDAWLV